MAENEEYYEPDIISVTDDDGNELLFELLERYETDDDVMLKSQTNVVSLWKSWNWILLMVTLK